MSRLIIFTHHFVDDFVLWNFKNLKNLNPDWLVLPIGFEGHQLLSGSSVASKDNYPNNKLLARYRKKSEEWLSPDLLLWEAYRQNPHYDEYFLYEYDTVCNVSIDSFFDTNLDFFCPSVHCNTPSDQHWWVSPYRTFNPLNVRNRLLYTVGQYTCLYFKNCVLKSSYEEVTANPRLYDNLLSEIRTGTIVKKFTDLKNGHEGMNNFINWKPIEMDFSKEYFYHPVKSFSDMGKAHS